MKLSRTVLHIPERIIVAVSGGPDSMALLDYCRQSPASIAAVVNINHGTEFSLVAGSLVRSYCDVISVNLEEFSMALPEHPCANKEAYWHDERANIYKQVSSKYGGIPVLTGHTLDDAIEWWLLTSFKGAGKLLSSVGLHRTYRPLLLTDRSEVRDFADRRGVPYLDDPTNIGFHNDRARLRTLPIEQLFPYVRGTVRNMLERNNEL